MSLSLTNNQISSDKLPIKEVFRDLWFSIPNYQRPYVWGEDQITNLLDDVLYAAQNTPKSQYFLGSLVLHCQEKRSEDNSTYLESSVLDGQQRLTTLYLLHAVLRDLSNNEKIKDTCAQSIFQEGNIYDGTPERLRIEFEIRTEVVKFIANWLKVEGKTQDEAELQTISKTHKNLSIRNMAKAILIINRWFKENKESGIDELFLYLRQYVIIVYVASDNLEDAFRLFTVLNDRGIRLRSSDILKAQNLKEVSTDQKREQYARDWETLEGDLGESFDIFLSYIRTVLVKEKARNNLLKEFEDNIYQRKRFNQSTKKYESLPPLLARGDETFDLILSYKEHLDQVFSNSNFHLHKNFAFDNLIAVLKDTALSEIWIPPLLAYKKTFGETNIYTYLTKLDNKFSGDWIARETPTYRIEAMNSIIKEMEKVSRNDSLTKEEQIKQLLASSVFSFDENEFMLQIQQGTIYGRRFARYILRKVDFLLDAPLYQEQRVSYNQMSVEHVLPQNPHPDSQWMKDFSLLEREEWTHRLGNLALISKRKNSKQGRLDFAQKKKRYFEKSIETFPNSLRIMLNTDWTMIQLQKQHETLVELIKKHYLST